MKIKKLSKYKIVVGRMLSIFAGVFFLAGCQTAAPIKTEEETSDDVESALSAVAGALGGKELDQEDLKRLEKQIRTDEDAQSAIQVITESVGGDAQVKYCPITGKRYAPHLEMCPEHAVLLEIVSP